LDGSELIANEAEDFLPSRGCWAIWKSTFEGTVLANEIAEV
jgi:hypothetical protein